jgi:hypothetical protein
MIYIVYLKYIPPYKYISARILVYREMVKIKYFFLSTTWRHTDGVEVWLHSFLKSVLDGVVNSRIECYKNVAGEY